MSNKPTKTLTKDPVIRSISPATPSQEELAMLMAAATSSSNVEAYKLLYEEEVINSFVVTYGLKEGSASVAIKTIFQIFEDRFKTGMSIHKFSFYFKKYFTYKRTGGIMFIKIDPETLGLPPHYSLYKDKNVLKPKKKRKRYGKEAQKTDEGKEG